MRTLLLDIDHTISDAAWRDRMIGIYSWDEYHLAGADDKPIDETIRLIQDLHKCGWTLIGLTARPEKWRKLTMDWCVRHGVFLDELLMRPDKDFLPSPECKVNQVQLRFPNGYDEIAMVLDDRLDVISAFRAIGVTAFQIFAKMSTPILEQDDLQERVRQQNIREHGIDSK